MGGDLGIWLGKAGQNRVGHGKASMGKEGQGRGITLVGKWKPAYLGTSYQ